MSKRTPLYEEHVRLHGKIVDFAGWEMPVQYKGLVEEHKAVRSAAGIFDVSHMGQIEFKGPDAEKNLQYITANDVTKLTDGRAQYSMFCNDRGTIVDDIIVYRFSPTRFIIVVNASNAQKDFEWCKSHAKGNVSVTDLSDNFALIAYQGPKAAEKLQTLTKVNLAGIGTYYFGQGEIAGVPNCILARTGYTGEDGFEIFCDPKHAPKIWQSLVEISQPIGGMAIGLGARDTLRLEMKYSLYGNEIDDTTNPIEAGLSWVIGLDSPDDFIGKKALLDVKAKGLTRKLIGFKMLDRGIPRHGYPVVIDGKKAGIVTSGTHSPSLNEPIGIAYVPVEHAKVGSEISIDIRGEARKAQVVKTPFYSKKS